ncbi:MAG: DUF2341 domain-containing protein, partial [Acidimicrobiia bacterium]
ITLPAFASYDITADETITVTVPATAVAGGSAIVATPTFDVLSTVIALVQKATAFLATAGTSITASYGSAPTQDNLLVLVHHYRDSATVTLPAGWTLAVDFVDGVSKITIGYKIAGAAEGTDVTVTTSVVDRMTITILEYSGIDTVSPLDQTSSNGCTAVTSCSTGTTGTTAQANELIVAGIGLTGQDGGWGNTWTNGFTQQTTVVSTGGGPTGDSSHTTADRIVSATGTFETTESWTDSRDAQGAIATFRAGPYDFRNSITIDRANVGVTGTAATTISNYPMLYKVTDTDLKSTPTGDVTDPEGDDIVFRAFDDATCGGAGLAPCTLDHEIEKYDGSTGELVAWVRVPSVKTNNVANTSDTVIYIYYGNSAVTTSTQNAAGVWDANHEGVWHLDETSGTTISDSTSPAENGTKVSATEPNPVTTGQIDGAQNFDGVNDNIQITGLMGSPADVTLSGWVNFSAVDTDGAEVVSLGDYVALRVDKPTDGTRGFFYDGAAWNPTDTTTNMFLSGTGWRHVVYTFDDTANSQKIYIDGAEQGSTTFTASISYAGLGTNTFIGTHGNAGLTWDFNGRIDEVRVSSVARNADWIKTEFNNMFDPGDIGTPGFYTVGAEEVL